jgi:hypothetical protein
MEEAMEVFPTPGGPTSRMFFFGGAAQFRDCDELEYFLFDLVHAEVVFVEHGLRVEQVKVVFGLDAVGQVADEIEELFEQLELVEVF